MAVEVTTAALADAGELAALAAATFPLACPPSADPGDIAAFVTENLSAERFDGYLRDADRRVLTARHDGRIIGYAMLIRGSGPDTGPAGADDQVELSKMYVLPEHHGAGAAAALMYAGLEWASEIKAHAVWLGVNRTNERAQRFYRKQGFAITSTRTFQVGSSLENDFVMVRRLSG